MSGSIHRGWAASGARVWVFLVLFAIAFSVSATEPDGHLRLQAEWVQANTKGGPPIVRLRIRSLVPLNDATLTVSAPFNFVLRPATPFVEADFHTAPAAPGRRAIRTSLQRLDTSAASTVDFELSLSPGSHGILEFIVEGRDSSGRTIRDAIGLAAGESTAGVHRLGAIEFPATVFPPVQKR